VRFPHISASLSRCILFTVLLTAFGAAETAGPNLVSRLYRRQSFLLGREGETLASPLVTIIDDPMIRWKITDGRWTDGR